MIDRRAFLKTLVGGVAVGAVAVREWPFRVYSFPAEVKVATTADLKLLDLGWDEPDLMWLNRATYELLVSNGIPPLSPSRHFHEVMVRRGSTR